MPTDLNNLVDNVIKATLTVDLPSFRPELAICLTIFAMLLVRVTKIGRQLDAFPLAIAGALVGLYYAAPWRLLEGGIAKEELFGGMLMYDGLTIFMRSLLLLFVLLFVVLTKLTGIPGKKDSTDFYCLVFGSTLGMCLMVSANHLLIVFLAVEMASLPSYVLAGLLRGNRKSSEAALKYAVYGAGAAGVMLYGISLLVGITGSAHLPTIAQYLSANLAGMNSQEYMVLSLGGLMIGVGLAFKLSAFPFHFWCPDVFEGAAAEVNAFLSVASKSAALVLLIRVALGVGFVSDSPQADMVAQQTGAITEEYEEMVFISTDNAEPSSEIANNPPSATNGQTTDAMEPVRHFIAILVAAIAALTCTFGNLAAYGQTNIKRLLAYSTIAHAGYMMMAIPAILAMVGVDQAGALAATTALGIYLSVYLFMNLGAFAIVAFLRNILQSEEIADYAGLIRRCPTMVICLSIILFSLVGLPPMAGFFGKFAIFASLVDGYNKTTAVGLPGRYLIVLLVVGGVNTAISLFYYLRVVKTMTISEEPEDRLPIENRSALLTGTYTVAITIPTVALIFWWDDLTVLVSSAVSNLLI